jgi:hypothetical protein
MPKTNEALDAVKKAHEKIDPNHLSIESLALLINAERLHHLEKQVTNEFIELKQRQDKVSYLHKVMKTINLSTNNKGEFDCSSQELKTILAQANEYGVEIDYNKPKYSKDERDRLLENIRMTVDDQNVMNDMQLQMITRLTNERYESYQMARAIMKPLHDDKVNKARAIAGR